MSTLCIAICVCIYQDTDRMEKVSQRINELETIKANLKLLGEMTAQYDAATTTDSEREMMKVCPPKYISP